MRSAFADAENIDLRITRRQREDGTFRVGLPAPGETRAALRFIEVAEESAVAVEQRFFVELRSSVLDEPQRARLWKPRLHRAFQFAIEREPPDREDIGSHTVGVNPVAVLDEADLAATDLAIADELLEASSVRVGPGRLGVRPVSLGQPGRCAGARRIARAFTMTLLF